MSVTLDQLRALMESQAGENLEFKEARIRNVGATRAALWYPTTPIAS